MPTERELNLLMNFLYPGKFGKSVILDAGCGTGAWSGVVRPFSTYLVGSDISPNCLKRAKERGQYDDLVLCDISRLPFRDKAFLALIGINLIEHLPKEDGIRALAEFERVSSRIYLRLPAEWSWQRQEWKAVERENPHEEHKSKWSIKELKGKGYKIRGIGERFSAPFIPSHLIGGLTYYFPRLASSLVAIKIV